MIEQLRRREYGYSSGVLSPDATRFIVNIPKNASSYTLGWAEKHGWTAAEIINHNRAHLVSEMIVILRDPLQRWISGIAQYLNGYVLHVTGGYSRDTGPGPHDQYMSADSFIANYNAVVERLIFDNLDRHDDHVWPQCEFFENLLPELPRKYFYLDSEFDQKFAQYLGFDKIDGLYRNDADSNADIKKMQRFLRQRLDHRPELEQRIKNAYARDYELINKVFHD